MVEADPVLKTAVQALKAEFNPLRLFLFGSRANGTASADSDYDFVMVVKELDAEEQWKAMDSARQLLADNHIDADVFVYSQDDFAKKIHEFSTVPEIAFTSGLEMNLNE